MISHDLLLCPETRFSGLASHTDGWVLEGHLKGRVGVGAGGNDLMPSYALNVCHFMLAVTHRHAGAGSARRPEMDYLLIDLGLMHEDGSMVDAEQ